MEYCGQDSLLDYLNPDLVGGDWPVHAVYCTFVQGGAGIPGPVLSLVVFGTLGLTVSHRVQHPGPVIVAGILTAGTVAASAPAGGINIFAVVLFVGIAAVMLYVYQQAQDSL